MKRLLSLIALFVLFLLATLTFDHWFPWLSENLSDNKTSTMIQAIGSILEITFKATTLILGFLTFMGWKKKPQTRSLPQIETAAPPEQYVQERQFEPTPIETGAPLPTEESPFLGLSAFQKKDTQCAKQAGVRSRSEILLHRKA